MRVCFWGTYERNYPRNRNIIEGLRQTGVEVYECHGSILGDDFKPKPERYALGTGGLWNLLTIGLRLVYLYIRLCWRYFFVPPHEVMIVVYPGQVDVLFASLLARLRRKKLVFDAFISVYDTAVNDRKLFPENSIVGRLLWYLDYWSCKWADVVLLDTPQHVDYFAKTFHIPPSKCYVIPVGANPDIPPPKSAGRQAGGVFKVAHFGSYIPLHGLEYVVQAAKILEQQEDIEFEFIGTGAQLPEVQELVASLGLQNVHFVVDWMPMPELCRCLEEVNLLLGIFGDTDKAQRVVPHKAYDALAMRKPLLTGDSPATRTVFRNKEHAVLCRMADPAAIASAILELKSDMQLCQHIAERGHLLHQRCFTSKTIGKKVLNVLTALLGVEKADSWGKISP